MERKNYIECFICMEEARNPVTSICGHIFCWKCINAWLSDKRTHSCPVCKNGIDLNKMTRLYCSNDKDNDGESGPKNERVPPVENQNRPTFVNKN
jgi:E3 ubiquitin-protein ligase RNF5